MPFIRINFSEPARALFVPRGRDWFGPVRPGLGTHGTSGRFAALFPAIHPHGHPGTKPLTSMEAASDAPEAWFALDQDGRRLTLGGAWVTAQSAQLDEALRHQDWSGRGDVAIDARGVERLDSAGAWLMLRTRHALEAAGRKVSGLDVAPAHMPLLKAVEGTARFVADLLRRSFASSLRSKIGFLISRPATELLKHHLDPNNHNGAVFLGLNGIVVKSHGSASAAGVANAVHVTARLLEENVTERITADLARVGEDSLKMHRIVETGAAATGDAA